MGENPIEQAKQATEVLGSLIQAAGDNAEVKQAGSEIGKAALTLAKSVNVVLLPLAAINFGYDKAKEYFSNKQKFEKDFAEKTAKISPENIVEPKPSIAGPAMQGLAFSHDELNLKEMYLNLLANSMNKIKSSSIHPAFVEIIKQLSTEEVSVLNVFLKGISNHPIVEIRSTQNNGNYTTLKLHVLNIFSPANKQPIVIKNLDTYVENWVRLGIYAVSYVKHLSNSAAYNWVEERPEYKNAQALPGETLGYEKGIMELTAFGREFSKAIS